MKFATDLISKYLVSETIHQFELQGHSMPSKSWQSKVACEVTESESNVVFTVTGAKHSIQLDRGVPKEKINISYKNKSLTDWVGIRFNLSDLKQKERVSFLIVQKWKNEGMPTLNSLRYSSTGKRTGFVDETIKAISEGLPDKATKHVKDAYEIEIVNMIKMINAN